VDLVPRDERRPVDRRLGGDEENGQGEERDGAGRGGEMHGVTLG
jgi:hypothetical protein